MSDENEEPSQTTAAAEQSSKITFDEERMEQLARKELGDDDQHQHRHSSPLARTLSSFQGRGQHRLRRGAGGGLSDTKNDFDHNDRDDFATSGTVEIPMILSLNEDDNDTLSVNATKVALAWKVPPKRGAKWSASFASKSVSRRKLGYVTCTSRIGYDLLPSTQIYSEMDFGGHSRTMIGASVRTSRTSSVQVALGTVPCSIPGRSDAKMALSVQGRRNFMDDRIAGTMTFSMDSKSRFTVLRLALTTLVDRIPTLTVGFNMGVNNESPVQLSAENQRGLVSVGMGFKGLVLDGMIKRSLSNFAGFAIGVRADAGRGVFWLLQLERGDFAMKIPVTVCTKVDGSSAVATMYLAFLSCVIDGVVSDFIGAAKTKAPATNGEDSNGSSTASTMRRTASLLQLDKVREDAERQTSLMERQAINKRKKEEAKDGLVIERAVYYEEGNGGGKLDVSTQLQFWVTDSSLYLPSTSKSNLLGFYDVRGKRQQKQKNVPLSSLRSVWEGFWSEPEVAIPILYVRYKFEGAAYEISIRDDDELVLPSPSAVRV